MRFLPHCLTVLVLLSACSSTDTPADAPSGGGNAGSAGSGSAGSAGSGTAGAAGSAGSAGSGAPAFPAAFGSFVELGDSISDMSVVKGANFPYYYNLLLENDDAAYPQWAGLDLKTVFKVDPKNHIHGSHGGDQAADMPNQVTKLPATLPGPVLVAVTIGGNDIQNNALDVINMKDEPLRVKFGEKLAAYIKAITAPGRFGPGVEVYILQTDIYDPSDGAGDFKAQNCGGLLGFFPPTPTDPILKNWNDVLYAEVGKAPKAHVLPLQALFRGHGVSHKTDGLGWFLSDCIHPNKPGHHELRRLMWKELTGKDGPT